MTGDMRGRMITALQRTWDYIAADVLEMEGRGQVRRDVVIEMVLDADRLTILGGDRDAAVNFYQLPEVAQKKILKEAFPFRRYS